MANKTLKARAASREASKAMLNFISDTKEGKYTEQKPHLIQVTYQRVETEENKISFPTEGVTMGVALFGLTF